MDVVEIVPIPIAPDAQKTLTPAAVTPSHPSLFENPDREGRGQEGKPRHQPPRDPTSSEIDDTRFRDDIIRGTRIDIRA